MAAATHLSAPPSPYAGGSLENKPKREFITNERTMQKVAIFQLSANFFIESAPEHPIMKNIRVTAPNGDVFEPIGEVRFWQE